MSSRIIRGGGRVHKLKISAPSEGSLLAGSSQEHAMNVEKEAFEQGYAEGERIGKQMGEKIVEAVVKRYEQSITGLMQSHKQLAECMEEQTVRLALEIARKIVQRELTLDQDLITALAAVALKRVTGH